MQSSKTTLILAAHPDDEVLGCGGLIPKLIQAGTKVYITILGEGITSREQQRSNANINEIEQLHSKAHAVAQFLGVQKLFLEKLPDNRFDTVPLLDVVKVVEKYIHQLQPDTVFVQHGGDLNVDHVTLFRAAMTATRPMHNTPVQRLYSYEVASSTEWSFGQFAPRFQPNTFVDIADTLETKVAAMQMYESEARVFPHPRSPEALRASAQRYGAMIGLAAAEPFQLIWARG